MTHRTLRPGFGAAIAVALVLGGCSASYVEQDGSSVVLLVEDIAESAPVLSDVRGENGLIVNCQATLTLSARPKNPNAPLGFSEDVRVSRYSISYRRSDGRGVPGVDVPYTITGSLTALVTAGTGGGTEVTLDLVRHQAKLEPPLSNIVGLQVVTMFADVTVSGQTISGNAVSGTGSAQVTFADFADGTDTCEG